MPLKRMSPLEGGISCAASIPASKSLPRRALTICLRKRFIRSVRCSCANAEGDRMAIPFYVAPDQMVQDKAEYARKGIAKGKSIVAMESAVGITLVAENP